MILISRKVDYAILVLCELMRQPAGLSARELSTRFNLSRPFIANILKQLCQQGFLISHRGVHGGYRLARPAADISLEEVIAALDGPFQLMACAVTDEEQTCGLVRHCPVRSPLRLVHQRLVETLRDVTLDQLGGAQADSVLVPLTGDGKRSE